MGRPGSLQIAVKSVEMNDAIVRDAHCPDPIEDLGGVVGEGRPTENILSLVKNALITSGDLDAASALTKWGEGKLKWFTV